MTEQRRRELVELGANVVWGIYAAVVIGFLVAEILGLVWWVGSLPPAN